MEKIKEKPSTNNVKKETISISEAIRTLEQEVQNDRDNLMKKIGALSMLKQVKE